MDQLILIRHGQSQHQVTDMTGGWSDSRLTELGRRQAKLTGRRLMTLLGGELLSPMSQEYTEQHRQAPSGAPGREVPLYCSDLARAAETAEIISRALTREGWLIPITARHGLRELNNGQAANLTRVEANLISVPRTDPLIDWIPYPGAESWAQMQDRIHDEMESLDGIEPSTAIVVSHGGSGICIILWWLGLDRTHREGIAFHLDTCSITRLGINEWDERTIYKLNDTCHLDRIEEA